ncbi:hypothetical protein NFJ02_07g131670 [Pycnococcus provasolii]
MALGFMTRSRALSATPPTPVSSRRRRRRPTCSSECSSQSPSELLRLVDRKKPDDDGQIKAIIQQLTEQQKGNTLDSRAFTSLPWQVVWSEGTMAWRPIVAKAVQAVAGESRAGQAIDVASGDVLNWAELFGARVTITAKGTCKYKRDRMPCAFDVSIVEGMLTFGDNAKFDLPISGPGEFEVLYANDKVRIFRSSGGIAVQVPSDFEM